jgi:hypothetical protein
MLQRVWTNGLIFNQLEEREDDVLPFPSAVYLLSLLAVD